MTDTDSTFVDGEPTRYTLELWVLGQLAAEEQVRLEARAAGDAELQRWMDRVRSEIESAQVGLPELELPGADVEGLHGFRRRIIIGAVGALAIAAGVLFALRVGPPSGPDIGVVRGHHLDLEVVRVREGRAEVQSGVITAREGDRLQFEVLSGEDGVLHVFDVQDDGVVTRWHQVPILALQPWEGAAILDDWAGTERVYFVVTESPLGAGEFEQRITDTWRSPLVDLELVPGLRGAAQRSVLVLKGEP